MGRPAVRGKEIVTYGDDELIGINLGYNYYVEFENGTKYMLDSLWRNGYNDSLHACCKSSLQAKRCIKKAQKIAKRFEFCPYADYMLPNYTLCVKRSVRINNSEVKKQYRTCQLVDGDYVCLWINMSEDYIQKKMDRKRVFGEDSFLYMPDFQGSANAVMLWNDVGRKQVTQDSKVFGSVWGDNGEYIILLMPKEHEWVIDELIKGIKEGFIAFISEEPKLFHDRGGILLNVEVAYRPRFKTHRILNE